MFIDKEKESTFYLKDDCKDESCLVKFSLKNDVYKLEIQYFNNESEVPYTDIIINMSTKDKMDIFNVLSNTNSFNFKFYKPTLEILKNHNLL